MLRIFKEIILLFYIRILYLRIQLEALYLEEIMKPVYKWAKCVKGSTDYVQK